jgi:hypothetical protein
VLHALCMHWGLHLIFSAGGVCAVGVSCQRWWNVGMSHRNTQNNASYTQSSLQAPPANSSSNADRTADAPLDGCLMKKGEAIGQWGGI